MSGASRQVAGRLLAALAVALVAGACGTGGDAVPAAQPLPEPATAPATPEPPAAVAAAAEDYWSAERVEALEEAKSSYTPPPERAAEPEPTQEPQDAPSDDATPAAAQLQTSDPCEVVRTTQGAAARVVRDWEENLAVQADVARRLEPLATDMAELAGRLSGTDAEAVQAYSDAIAALRLNFVSDGDTVPSDSTQPTSYNSRKIAALAGVEGC